MTHRRNPFAALALATVVVTALLPRAASASKADAFEGKIQPVSGQLYRKAGRIELTAGGAMSLNDAFFAKYLGDLKLSYHFTEHWSASVHGAFGTAIPTDSTTVCPTGEGCRDATDAELWQVPGRIHGLAGAEVAWSPIYGKLNVFSQWVAHIDLSVVAGADYILHDEVVSTADARRIVEANSDPLVPDLPAPGQLSTLGFHVGIGARIFVTEAFAVRLDLKDYVYGATVPNGDSGPNGTDIQNQLFVELGVSYFFPSFYSRRQP